MVKKCFFIFFLLSSLISCQQNHKSQNATAPNGIISKNRVMKWFKTSPRVSTKAFKKVGDGLLSHLV